MAARGACAAAQSGSADRRAHEFFLDRSRRSGAARGIHAVSWRARLDRRPQCADRRALGASNVDLMRTFAKELIGLQPDVLLATSTPVTAALARETQTIPIVF